MNAFFIISLIVIPSSITGLLIFLYFKLRYENLEAKKVELNKLIVVLNNDKNDLYKHIKEHKTQVYERGTEIRIKDATISELRHTTKYQSDEIESLRDQLKACNDKFQQLVQSIANNKKW